MFLTLICAHAAHIRSPAGICISNRHHLASPPTPCYISISLGDRCTASSRMGSVASTLTRRWNIIRCEPGVFSRRSPRLARVYGEGAPSNNSQGSHTPLKTAQQAPHQGSFEKEMSKERKARSRSRRSHISKLLILFFKVIQTLSGD